MTADPEKMEKLCEKLGQQVVGRQAEIEKILAGISGVAKRTSDIVLTGPAGAGKTAIFEAEADKFASKAFTDRFKDVVLMKPFGPLEIGKLVDMLVDRHERMPADRKEEARAIMHEMVGQGAYDEKKGLRALRPIVDAIAEVSSEPDMREALARKYPLYLQRASVRSGERLADAFTNGTNDRTQARKPYRLKSRGVGFFALH